MAKKNAKLTTKKVDTKERYLVVRTEKTSSVVDGVIEVAVEHVEEVFDAYDSLEQENVRLVLTKEQCVETLQYNMDEDSDSSEYKVYKVTPVNVSLTPKKVTPAVVKFN